MLMEYRFRNYPAAGSGRMNFLIQFLEIILNLVV